VLALGLVFSGSIVSAESAPWRWDDVERVVVVGDVHGAFDSMVGILVETGVVDENGAWIGGGAHLVMLGDIVDRGSESRDALDLLIRLQTEAELAGGQLHFVLGNHEIMNLVGELGYTSETEFAAFAKDEEPKERKAAFKRMMGSSLSQNGDPKKMRKVFNKRHPPGYFGHRKAFSSNGVYGSWLLDQHVLVVVNDVVFVHAGLSPTFLEFDPDNIDAIAMGQLRQFMTAQHELMEAGVLTPEMSFKTQVSEVSEILQKHKGDRDVLRAASELFSAAEGLVFRRDGPVWYRGSALNPEDGEQALVAEVLQHLGVDRVVVGHTPVHTDRITTRFDGAVVLADTGMLTEHYGGRASAVVMNDGVLYEAYTGEGEQLLNDQRWDKTPEMFASDDDYIEFLETAPVVFMRPVGSGTSRPMEVWLAQNGRRCRGIFKLVDEGDRRYEHEVAAYRLDRLLNHGMVPPTGQREVGGMPGSIQLWMENVINEEDRVSEDIQLSDPVENQHQRDHAAVFDLLVFNVDRHGSNMFISTVDEKVWLIDHERAFKPEIPSRYYLEDARSKLDEDLRELLVELDVELVREELSEFLTGEQIDALLERRDLLLATDE
jgi:hypothetical protein